MSNKELTKAKIEEDEDFINCPSADNSLEKFLKKHPNGTTDEKIAQVLMLDKEDVEDKYQEAIILIKDDMKVE